MEIVEHLKILKDFIATCGGYPGVYKMLDAQKNILYIGKAKNLKSRLSDYLQYKNLTKKTQTVISGLHSLEVIVTNNELEAILLESNLIKKHKPKYNILLKDGKSFPYICIDESSEYPKLIKYRGKKNANSTYWGPFASADKIDDVINIIQKSFLLRNCNDHFFANRKRACILHQIKRCSAPCVNKISARDYHELVKQAKEYLSGKNDKLHKDLQNKMKEASDNMQYEEASVYRDRLSALESIKSKQVVSLNDNKDIDIIVAETSGELSAIEVFFIRDGINLGNKTYYFENTEIFSNNEILSDFIYSFYSKNEPGTEILLNAEIEDSAFFERFIKDSYNKKVKISVPSRGIKKDLLNFASTNAQNNLSKKISKNIKTQHYFVQLKKLLKIERLDRIEIYDNSHFSGDQPLGVMVVADKNGFNKSEYRKFNIKNPSIKHDDYGMMKEVFDRRFRNNKIAIPDLVIIDGGQGQLSTALSVIKSHDININVISFAKGEQRNSGEETIYMPDNKSIYLDKHDLLKHYLQILRDEAHRFAITSNRKKMEAKIKDDKLKQIPGIGDKTQKKLLQNFGSVKKVEEASIDELYAAPGISKKNAQNIYQYFHTRL